MKASTVGIKKTTFLIAALLFMQGHAAHAYRPFISTDAGVADLHEVEIEMGYFNLSREGAENTYTVPETVLNYGILNRVEAVAQIDADKTDGEPLQLGEPSLSVKVVAKEGFLQDKPGDSVAFETDLLPSSVVKEEHRTGFQETGIWSHPLLGMIFHVNLGGGIDQYKTDAFLFMGTIAERPLTKTFRLVGEITSQSQPELAPNNSGLLGVIWETPNPNLFLDAGARRGLSTQAPDWQLTTGFSYGFIFPQVPGVQKK
jgi:hypothetical protein